MDVKVEEKAKVKKHIFGEARGKYTVLDAAKQYSFEFPLPQNYGEIYSVLSFIRDEIFNAIQKEKEAEEKAKEKKPFNDKLDEVKKDCEKMDCK